MKKIIILILFININYVYAENVKNARELYLTACNNKSTCDSLSNYLNQLTEKDNTINAYIGANNLLISKFSKNIIKKFKYFEEGRKIIEQSIKNDPENIEIVFLRYLNQRNSPWFLNYNQNLVEDYDFLIKNLNFISDPYFKNVIQKILKNNY
jgi:hypothetical protein